ncbi:macro domain-containing protein [Nonomuraea lactucae]|uniref:macro domain-containing protein n=1 Tax=Nonomuraea lactucae TaxID=2249762 RepID=UPI000DE42AFF|nr:macro domain-containing protein [Nonomuraea lactucae]
MQPPSHDQLTADLRSLREKGLTRMRDARLSALHAATVLCGTVGEDPEGQALIEPYRPAAMEELVRRAVAELGGGHLTGAAEYTFGLASGTRDWPIGERRKSAASVYGVSVERFRKHHEQLIINETAEAILRLCLAATTASTPSPAGLRRPATRALGPVILDFMPVELINGVHIVVSSENVYLEASKIFRNSLSAALRRACAEVNEAGEIVDDVIRRELTQWLRVNGRLGLPVAPGSVAVTEAGRLRRSGVQRVYHAAVATPCADGNQYEFSVEAMTQAVRNVFRLAEHERALFAPPLRSIALPLFGAGRGGLDPAQSLDRLWSAIEREIDADTLSGWELHIITHAPRDAEAVIRRFGQESPADRLGGLPRGGPGAR